jgi:hypothetical protein
VNLTFITVVKKSIYFSLSPGFFFIFALQSLKSSLCLSSSLPSPFVLSGYASRRCLDAGNLVGKLQRRERPAGVGVSGGIQGVSIGLASLFAEVVSAEHWDRPAFLFASGAACGIDAVRW